MAVHVPLVYAGDRRGGRSLGKQAPVFHGHTDAASEVCLLMALSEPTAPSPVLLSAQIMTRAFAFSASSIVWFLRQDYCRSLPISHSHHVAAVLRGQSIVHGTSGQGCSVCCHEPLYPRQRERKVMVFCCIPKSGTFK